MVYSPSKGIFLCFSLVVAIFERRLLTPDDVRIFYRLVFYHCIACWVKGEVFGEAHAF